MPDEIKELRIEYLQDIKSRLKKLEEDIEAKNIYTVMNFAHRIKGSGATFGFAEFTEIAVEMENIMKDIDWESISKYYEKIAASLNKYIEKNHAEEDSHS